MVNVNPSLDFEPHFDTLDAIFDHIQRRLECKTSSVFVCINDGPPVQVSQVQGMEFDIFIEVSKLEHGYQIFWFDH